MAFDQNTRNRLQNFVSEARTLLTDEFTRQLQNDYGLDPATGEVSELEKLTHIDDARHQTARLLRDTLNHYQAGSPSGGPKEALNRIVREQAFTVLNRICALRMAEAREILIESIGNGYNSKGFQLYARLAGTGLGETGDAYRCYLFSLFDEFAVDLTVLFDRYSSMGRLFPRESVLPELLGKINDVEIASLWAEDETIGWIYQYFNSKEERKKMRDESQAPRNSRELAVRNQFFTPRYVVEFLTDNTLGRIWYEMTQGNTSLRDSCRYLVRRPNEIFLAPGEAAPEDQRSEVSGQRTEVSSRKSEVSGQRIEVSDQRAEVEMTQEELLRQPVYIPHRPLKDPREIRMLDPACGSMHFGLYAFDLFEKIYEEAWDMEDSGRWMKISGQKSVGSGQRGSSEELTTDYRLLTTEYASKEAFLRDVPRLIIEHNIHGVDIDPRAVQIAGLSLWLRAQRTWKEQNVKPADRPQIRKSNIVCAEPMPGEKDLLREFTENLKPRVLGQLLEIIFEKMELAGEAGSLLKIEEEIEEAAEQAREEFNKELLSREQGEQGALFPELEAPKQQALFDFADLPDKTRFWQTAEQQILDALRRYAEQAEAGDSFRRRLFSEDAAKGFAFIELCRKRFDVVVMNPPFGDLPDKIKGIIAKWFPLHSNNILNCFISRAKHVCVGGYIGSVIDRTILIKNSYDKFRNFEMLEDNSLCQVLDLGWEVLDANVEVSSIVFSKSKKLFVQGWNLVSTVEKENLLSEIIQKPETLTHRAIEAFPFSAINLQIPHFFRVAISAFPKLNENGCIFYNGHTIKSDVFKRLYWEIDLSRLMEGSAKRMWNGSSYSPFRVSFQECVLIRKYAGGLFNHRSTILRNTRKHAQPGLCFGKRGDYLDVQILPEGFVLTNEGFGGGVRASSAFSCLSYLNSRVAQYSINLYCGQHKGVGYVNKLPFPATTKEAKSQMSYNARKGYDAMQSIQILCETDHLFSFPFPTSEKRLYSINALKGYLVDTYEKLSHIINENDTLYNKIFRISDKEKSLIHSETQNRSQGSPYYDCLPNRIKDSDAIIADAILSYLIGTNFGRWDIRYAIGEKEPLGLPDPFDPLPVCPPGMLQNTDGLPAEPKDVPPDYPLRISWGGILLDDEGHNEDIVGRVREGIEVIWKDKGGDIEQEACEIFGVRSLRDYFSKPAKFFADHLKRYSKSRRQAPIYWPLSTSSGSYTLWIYYHRLTDQTLYTCVNNFVEPKLAVVSVRLAHIRGERVEGSKQLEKEYERLTDFQLELKDFRDELLRIAKFWKPNLNDGVQITAAPLWKLFLHKPWQKKLKQTWEKLEKGDYDWAHLAYRIWPERVIRASHKDRSYAIAHDLEDDLWEGIEDGTDRQGNPKYKWVPKDLNKQEVKELIAEKVGGNA